MLPARLPASLPTKKDKVRTKKKNRRLRPVHISVLSEETNAD